MSNYYAAGTADEFPEVLSDAGRSFASAEGFAAFIRQNRVIGGREVSAVSVDGDVVTVTTTEGWEAEVEVQRVNMRTLDEVLSARPVLRLVRGRGHS